MNFVKRIKAQPVLEYASGTADRNSAIIDTRGVHGVTFICNFAAVGGAGSLKVQGGHLPDGSDMSDLEGTGEAFSGADANGVLGIEIGHSQFRYLRLVTLKGGATTAESAIAYLHSTNSEPVTQPSGDGVFFVHHHAPAQGTA